MQDFPLEPRVSERTDSNTFVVCEAIQVNPSFKNIRVSNGKAVFEFQKVPGSDDVVKGTPVQRQLNLFYPPQVKILTTVGAELVFFSCNLKVFFSLTTISMFLPMWTRLQWPPC